MKWLAHSVGFIASTIVLLESSSAHAMKFQLDMGEAGVQQVDATIKMVVLLTVLAMAPAILMTTTSFVRIAVVLSVLRTALGTQSTPPTQVVMGLSLFLTIAIMAPIGKTIYGSALSPYLDGRMKMAAAVDVGSRPLKTFMLRQTRESDLALFFDISDAERPNSTEEVPVHLLIPAFIISELRTAFEMGFVLFVPFLLLDLIVASVVMALGLVMLPPAMISLPLKLMVFVLADGWNLLVGSLVRSFA